VAELIEMPLGGGGLMWAKELCIRWSQGRTNSYAAATMRSDMMALRHFVEIL